MAKAAPTPPREVAQIVINLVGNMNQLCIRYASMKDAMKQFDKFHDLMGKPEPYDGKKADRMFAFTGTAVTSVVKTSRVEAYTLVDVDTNNALLNRSPSL